MAAHAGEEVQERPPGVDADDPDVHEAPLGARPTPPADQEHTGDVRAAGRAG
jgi:hypothetical protein